MNMIILLGPSSSAAKKADAAFKISFARRSSRFSRSNALSRSRSSVVNPGRRPSSISTRRTHRRTVSGVGPNFSATETDRLPLRPAVPLGLKDHPHRPITHLRRVSPRSSLLCHDSILARSGACALPGEVHFSAWAEIFGDAVAVEAMVDRLVHHSHVHIPQRRQLPTQRQTTEVVATAENT